MNYEILAVFNAKIGLYIRQHDLKPIFCDSFLSIRIKPWIQFEVFFTGKMKIIDLKAIVLKISVAPVYPILKIQ